MAKKVLSVLGFILKVAVALLAGSWLLGAGLGAVGGIVALLFAAPLFIAVHYTIHYGVELCFWIAEKVRSEGQ